MAISTNPKPAIYRDLYEKTGLQSDVNINTHPAVVHMASDGNYWQMYLLAHTTHAHCTWFSVQNVQFQNMFLIHSYCDPQLPGSSKYYPSWVNNVTAIETLEPRSTWLIWNGIVIYFVRKKYQELRLYFQNAKWTICVFNFCFH